MVTLNIDMPSSCYRCPLIGEDGNCQAVGVTKNYINGRQDNCPIVDNEGCWIIKPCGYGALITCNKCGTRIKISPQRYVDLLKTEKYCSFCGAKMTGYYEDL